MLESASRFFRFLCIYTRLISGAVVKRSWSGSQLPAGIHSFHQSTFKTSRLDRWMELAWPAKAPGITIPSVQEPPCMFFPPEAFIAVMDCLAQLPFNVLGGVVNKKAVHTKFHAVVQPGDHLLHSASVAREVRETPGGHTEFDVRVTTTRLPSGEVLYEGTLTLVRLNPCKARNRSSLHPAGSDPTTTVGSTTKDKEEAAGKLPEREGGNAAVDEKDLRLLGNVKLGWSAGRRWAALDGDVSPMHLTVCTANLSGFKKTVANVSCVMAAVEGLVRAKGLIAPDAAKLTIQVEYKRPVYLPCNLEVRVNETAPQAASRTMKGTVTTDTGQEVPAHITSGPGQQHITFKVVAPVGNGEELQGKAPAVYAVGRFTQTS